MHRNQLVVIAAWSTLSVLLIPDAALCAETPPSIGENNRAGMVVRVAAVSFVPKKFDLQGNVVAERCGKWCDNKLVWDVAPTSEQE